jgi:hypothetical protein
MLGATRSVLVLANVSLVFQGFTLQKELPLDVMSVLLVEQLVRQLLVVLTVSVDAIMLEV